MMFLILAMCGVALAYGLQTNRVPLATKALMKWSFTLKMMRCTYCLSAQCGFWFSVTWQSVYRFPNIEWKYLIMDSLAIGLASAALSLPLVLHDIKKNGDHTQ